MEFKKLACANSSIEKHAQANYFLQFKEKKQINYFAKANSRLSEIVTFCPTVAPPASVKAFHFKP